VEGSRSYAGFWNFVDWLSFLFAFAIISMWVIHLVRLHDLRDYLASADADVIGSWPDSKTREDYFELVHTIVEESREFRIILGMYPFVIVSKFFKAFNNQPRLSMVTRTLSAAAVDIVHFAVVFFTVFCIFALSALIIFGKELRHFANYHRALHSTFLILLGDFDWESMIHVGRPQSYLWFWTLIWLVNLVMLNMLLAIVMDVYTEVRKSIMTNDHVETMWSQAWEIYNNTINNWRGTHVPIKLVLRTLAGSDVEASKTMRSRSIAGTSLNGLATPEEEDEVLTLDFLFKVFPRMSEDQAVETLIGGLEIQRLENKEEAEAIMLKNRRMLKHIFHTVDHIVDAMQSWRDDRSERQEGAISNDKRAMKAPTGKTDGLDWPLERDAGFRAKRLSPIEEGYGNGHGNGNGRAEWSV
jgi:hypothetical protein